MLVGRLGGQLRSPPGSPVVPFRDAWGATFPSLSCALILSSSIGLCKVADIASQGPGFAVAAGTGRQPSPRRQGQAVAGARGEASAVAARDGREAQGGGEALGGALEGGVAGLQAEGGGEGEGLLVRCRRCPSGSRVWAPGASL